MKGAMKGALTRKQKVVLDCIAGSIQANGYAPTLHEICASVGLRSVSTAHKHVQGLVSRGFITKKADHSRAIKLVEQNPATKAAPDLVKALEGMLRLAAEFQLHETAPAAAARAALRKAAGVAA